MGAPEASEYLGVVLRTLYKLIDEGAIPAYKVGRVIRLKREDVDAFLESQRIKPGSLSHLYPPYGDHRGEDAEDDTSGLSLAELTVTVAQAGEMLGLSRAEAFRRAKTGELVPGVQVLPLAPRLTRVSRAQIDEYLKRQGGSSGKLAARGAACLTAEPRCARRGGARMGGLRLHLTGRSIPRRDPPGADASQEGVSAPPAFACHFLAVGPQLVLGATMPVAMAADSYELSTTLTGRCVHWANSRRPYALCGAPVLVLLDYLPRSLDLCRRCDGRLRRIRTGRTVERP